MACNCKHQKQEIENHKKEIEKLRRLFIRRMTVDSEHNDRRRKDYNQSIFGWADKNETDPSKTFQCWADTDMAMVLQCFDDAVYDWRRTWCDVDNCRRT